MEHHGGHSRTPANQRWDQMRGRGQRFLLGQPLPQWMPATQQRYIWRFDTGCGPTLYRECHSHNTPRKMNNNTWVELLAGNCTTSSTRQREQVWQKCKIQKNWCTVTVAPIMEHHGGHSRTPANRRWEKVPGRSQRLLLGQPHPPWMLPIPKKGICGGLTLDVNQHYIGSVTATTHQEKGIITLESNPSRGTVLPAPHGKGNNCKWGPLIDLTTKIVRLMVSNL